MKNIRFSLGYMESPLFCTDADNMGEVDFNELNISELLKYDLGYLDKIFQSTIDESYPPHSGLSSPEANVCLWEALTKESESIFKRLAEELRGVSKITYVPIKYSERKIASIDSRHSE